MKKRICLLLLVVLILLIPHAASANSAARNPWEIDIYVTNVPEGSEITVHLLKADGSDRALEPYTANGGVRDAVWVMFEEGETAFYLVCVTPDGTETRSDTVEIVTYGKYDYNGRENTIKDRTKYYNNRQSCVYLSGIVLFIALLFFVPIAITLLVEWLTALCFRLRPTKYVLAINAITNPVMNILLLIVSSALIEEYAAYWIVLAMLEIAVVAIEYWFYTKKYAEIKRSRLLVFTVTANVLSLAIGLLVRYWFF